MAKYEFKLESLLKLRKMRQEQSERELAEQTSQFLSHRRSIDRLDLQVRDFYQEIRNQQAGGEITINGLLANRRYLGHLHQMRHHEQSILEQSRQQVDQARRQVAEAKKQTDILVKLKERMHNRFKKEQQRREIAELDDLANAKTAWAKQQIAADA